MNIYLVKRSFICEVEKLSLYTKHIHYEDVDKLVSKPLEEDGFELVSAIMKKDQCKCMEIYKDLMIQNYEPIMLIIMISNQIRLAYEIKILERKGYQHFEMAKMLGINPYRIKYIKQDMGLFDKQDLLDKLEELALLDRNIKQGRIDKKNADNIYKNIIMYHPKKNSSDSTSAIVCFRNFYISNIFFCKIFWKPN